MWIIREWQYKTQNQSSTEHDNGDKFPKRGITLHEVVDLQKRE